LYKIKYIQQHNKNVPLYTMTYMQYSNKRHYANS